MTKEIWQIGNFEEKNILLKHVFLKAEENLYLYDFLHKYKVVFGLRDEVGYCPNIEVDIKVTDKSPSL